MVISLLRSCGLVFFDDRDRLNVPERFSLFNMLYRYDWRGNVIQLTLFAGVGFVLQPQRFRRFWQQLDLGQGAAQ